MTAGELDVCGVGIVVVSDEVGEVEMLVFDDDFVVFGDDPLLVCVSDCLSVVSDAMLRGAGVARRGRGDTGPSVVFGPGVHALHLVGCVMIYLYGHYIEHITILYCRASYTYGSHTRKPR